MHKVEVHIQSFSFLLARYRYRVDILETVAINIKRDNYSIIYSFLQSIVSYLAGHCR
uniref:Uncharacterized protein n=1 Tax=Rhizophora mucronata TaxID=61149 RepID=A0A2P2JKM4_RHIMU